MSSHGVGRIFEEISRLLAVKRIVHEGARSQIVAMERGDIQKKKVSQS